MTVLFVISKTLMKFLFCNYFVKCVQKFLYYLFNPLLCKYLKVLHFPLTLQLIEHRVNVSGVCNIQYQGMWNLIRKCIILLLFISQAKIVINGLLQTFHLSLVTDYSQKHYHKESSLSLQTPRTLYILPIPIIVEKIISNTFFFLF